MALTVTNVKKSVFGDQRVVIADVLMDNSYLTGGELLPAATLGLKTVNFAVAVQKNATTSIRVFQYDIANGKLLAFQQTDPAAAGGAAIPFPEVTSAVDLSATTVRIIAIGV